MRLLRNIYNLSKLFAEGAVVTIGNYDGVHLGHQEILQRVGQKAQELKLPSVVVIFEPQPEEFFVARKDYARLTSLREKLQQLQHYHIDYVLCLRFNAKFAAMSATEFMQKILLEALQVKYLVVGDDFVFGKKREGNFALLENFALHNSFAVEQMQSFKIHGVRVSSTMIRVALQSGDLQHAALLLGRPYTILGRVVHGDKIGRNIGFPTANIYLPHKVFPLSGVYAVKVHFQDGCNYYGVANVGFRPTVGDSKKRLEVYIFELQQDIYGIRVEIEFVQKIRDEVKFASFALLRQQISYDVMQAKQLFNLKS